jgi:hypothetical protein
MMEIDVIKARIVLAQNVVKNIEPSLREKAFEVVLRKLLEEDIHEGELGVVPSPKAKATGIPRSKARGSHAPIPLDLKGGDGQPSLRDLFKQKAPTSNQEKTTLFVYFLNKCLGITDVTASHVISCFNEVGERKPLKIDQMFRDIRNRKGWLESGETLNSARITIAGENFIDHDLPKK